MSLKDKRRINKDEIKKNFKIKSQCEGRDIQYTCYNRYYTCKECQHI